MTLAREEKMNSKPFCEMEKKRTYKTPSKSIKRMFFVIISRRQELLLFNQLPSEALLLLLSRSGGDRNLFVWYGAVELTLLFFVEGKQPTPGQLTDDDIDSSDSLHAPRIAFVFDSDFDALLALFIESARLDPVEDGSWSSSKTKKELSS